MSMYGRLYTQSARDPSPCCKQGRVCHHMMLPSFEPVLLASQCTPIFMDHVSALKATSICSEACICHIYTCSWQREFNPPRLHVYCVQKELNGMKKKQLKNIQKQPKSDCTGAKNTVHYVQSAVHGGKCRARLYYCPTRLYWPVCGAIAPCTAKYSCVRRILPCRQQPPR